MIMMNYVDELTIEVIEEVLEVFSQKASFFYFSVQNMDDYSVLCEWMRENSECIISKAVVSRWPGTGFPNVEPERIFLTSEISVSELAETLGLPRGDKVLGIKIRITEKSKESLLQSVLPVLLSRDYSLDSYFSNDIGCDISILQEDGHPWFITTRHEGFVYLILYKNEVARAIQVFDKRLKQCVNSDSAEVEYNLIY